MSEQMKLSAAVAASLNDWAKTANKSLGEMEKATNQREGAYQSLMEAATQFASECEEKEVGAAFRAAIKLQMETVWTRAPKTYGRVVKVKTTEKDGKAVTRVSLTGSAANAVSVIVGAFEFGHDVAKAESFGGLRKEVEASRAAKREADAVREHGEALVKLRKEATEELAALAEALAAIDDEADLGPMLERVNALKVEALGLRAASEARASKPAVAAETLQKAAA